MEQTSLHRADCHRDGVMVVSNVLITLVSIAFICFSKRTGRWTLGLFSLLHRLRRRIDYSFRFSSPSPCSAHQARVLLQTNPTTPHALWHIAKTHPTPHSYAKSCASLLPTYIVGSARSSSNVRCTTSSTLTLSSNLQLLQTSLHL